MEFLHPPHWMRPSGYSNGVAAEGRQIFVAGQIAWDAERQIVSDDFVAQVEQALRNIVHVLAEAGARPEDLVRLTWYVVDKREYLARSNEVGEAYRAGRGEAHRVLGEAEGPGSPRLWRSAWRAPSLGACRRSARRRGVRQ